MPELLFYTIANPYTVNEVGLALIDVFVGTAPETVLGQGIALGKRAGEGAVNIIK